MEECVFCKIVNGNIPAAKIFEDKNTVAFLDIAPVAKGHALVLPKKHCESLLELGEKELGELAASIKKVVPKILKAVDAKAFNLMQNNGRESGQLVKHVHFHIIPRWENDGKGFDWPQIGMGKEEIGELAKKILGE